MSTALQPVDTGVTEESITQQPVTNSSHEAMSQDIGGWGIALTLWGIANFVVPGMEPVWGGILLAVGCLSLIIRHPVMFIPIGGVLIVLGVLNFLTWEGFWMTLGVMQISWGLREIAKIGR